MQTVIRVVLIYFAILIGLRVMGKREFSQMTTLELISLLLIPELVAQGLVGEDFSITNAILALCKLFVLVFVNSVFMHRFNWYSKIVTSKPVVLVDHGQYCEGVMNKERISPDDVFEEMHKIGLLHLSEVRWAILETSGKISIVPYTTMPMARKGKGEVKIT